MILATLGKVLSGDLWDRDGPDPEEEKRRLAQHELRLQMIDAHLRRIDARLGKWEGEHGGTS